MILLVFFVNKGRGVINSNLLFNCYYNNCLFIVSRGNRNYMYFVIYIFRFEMIKYNFKGFLFDSFNN